MTPREKARRIATSVLAIAYGQPAVRKDVDGRQLLGQKVRLPLRENENSDAEANTGRRRG
jgi:hypothetical protein